MAKLYADVPAGLARTIPASTNPANVSWDIESGLSNDTTPPANLSIMTPPQQQRPKTMNSNEQLQFVLKKVAFTGVSHTLPIPVAKIYQQYIDKLIDANDLFAMQQHMQEAYRDAGYLLVRVVLPPQEIDKSSGEVTFQIVEGQIQRVIFTGDMPRGAKAQLERYANAIAEEDPITYQTIDRFLQLANSLPGINVNATLVPNLSVPGGSDLIIKVTQKSLSGFVTYNNHNSDYIGPDQAFFGMSLNDLLAADSLSFTGGTTPGNLRALYYYSLGYSLTTGKSGTELNLQYSNTETRPGSSLSAFEMYGTSDKLTLGANQPLITSNAQKLKWTNSFYYLQSRNNAQALDTELYDDQVTAFTTGLTYQGVYWQMENSMDGYFTFGVPVGIPSTLSDPSRINGKNRFTLFDFDTSSIHYFTQRFSAAFNTTGQYTTSPLLTSEQLGYGGSNFGQAFTPYIISGDSGIFGVFALRYDLPTFGAINLLQPEIFYDVGYVKNNDALLGTYGEANASSAGIGLNVIMLSSVQIQAVLAKPITLTQVSGVGNAWQGFVNFVATF